MSLHPININNNVKILFKKNFNFISRKDEKEEFHWRLFINDLARTTEKFLRIYTGFLY